MIIAKTPNIPPCDFERLLEKTKEHLLLNFSKKDLLNTGVKFEPYVFKSMTTVAQNTPFDQTIEMISGQKFPDIIANKYYGVEVKTTKQKHWKTTGNSVLETTRVESVENIYIFFAQLSGSLSLRFRKYEECLYDVAVTHSPRYLVDMDTLQGESIFDKIEIEYDVLRKKDNPILSIQEYYRKSLKRGEAIWWLSKGDEEPSSEIKIKNLNEEKEPIKDAMRVRIMCFFPEIFGSSNKKFSNIPAWLVTQYGYATHSLRDFFSAGGRFVDANGVSFPKIFEKVFNYFELISQELLSADCEELKLHWGQDVQNNRLNQWVNFVVDYSFGISKPIAREGKKLGKDEILQVINQHFGLPND
jgi:hypothetical protein